MIAVVVLSHHYRSQGLGKVVLAVAGSDVSIDHLMARMIAVVQLLAFHIGQMAVVALTDDYLRSRTGVFHKGLTKLYCWCSMFHQLRRLVHQSVCWDRGWTRAVE